MNREEIERILSSEPQIRPRPDFMASVMNSVQQEVQRRSRLDFPWRQALPAFLALLVAVIALVDRGTRVFSDAAVRAALNQSAEHFMSQMTQQGLHWVVLVFGLTLVAAAISTSIVSSDLRYA